MAPATDVRAVMSHLWQARYRRQTRPPSLSESLAAEFYRRGFPEQYKARSGHSPDVKMMFAREYELRAVVLRYTRAVHSGITGCPLQRYA